MRFALIHLDDIPHGEDEVVVIVPGGPKTAFCVPLGALGGFLPLLAEGAEALPAARCPGCSTQLPAGIDASYVDTLWV
ncbi:MAG TPA: hypothetical protein VL120_07990 [Solirubrobacteraceae bacterium]|nr:hypothetical protein [Solirubrobacteraceae bacterium]